MARVKNNDFTKGLSGKVGDQIVYKQYGDKTIVTKTPDMSKRKLSDLQKSEQRLFRRAVATHAKSIMIPKRKRLTSSP